MEFLLVKFEDDRQVLINGEENGRTNKILELEAGTYEISLKPPPMDFKPPVQTVVLEGTNALSPKVVVFEKI